MPREYCRTCGSDAGETHNCQHCGADPKKGHLYCNHCASFTPPQAPFCKACQLPLDNEGTTSSPSEPVINANKIAAIGLLLGFLLPWINKKEVGLFSGLDLYQYTNLVKTQLGERAGLLNIAYLIPILSLLLLLIEYKHLRIPGNSITRSLKLLSGLLPLLFTVWLLKEPTTEALYSISAGLILSLVCGCYFLIREALLAAGLLLPHTARQDYSFLSLLSGFFKSVSISLLILLVAVGAIFGLEQMMPAAPVQQAEVNVQTAVTGALEKQASATAVPEVPITDLLPDRNHPDRKPLMDTLRNAVVNDFNGPVKFIVYTLRSDGHYAFLFGKPVNTNETEINYNKTQFKEQHKKDGWDNNIQAVFRKENNAWTLVKYVVGCSTVCYYSWPTEYGFSKKLIGIDEGAPTATVNKEATAIDASSTMLPPVAEAEATAEDFIVYINKKPVAMNQQAYNHLRYNIKTAPCDKATKCPRCNASGYITDNAIILQKRDARAIKTCEGCSGIGYFCQ